MYVSLKNQTNVLFIFYRITSQIVFYVNKLFQNVFLLGLDF